MSIGHLNSERTGLLIFDMLNVYCRRGDESAQRRTELDLEVANCARLIQAARRLNIPIFYAKGDYRPDGTDSSYILTDTDYGLQPWPHPNSPPHHVSQAVHGSWKGEVIEELKPQPGDYIIPKQRWSAFYQTNLELCLRTRGIITIILTGGSTDVGIASTAFAARDMDLNLVIVRDACSTAHLKANHEQLMDHVFPRMARVRTTEQVLKMLPCPLNP